MVKGIGKSTRLNVIDRDKISAAIREAEKKTSGDIFAIFTKESDSYFFISFFVWTAAVFFISIAVAFGLYWGWHDVPLHYFALTTLIIHLLGLFYLSVIPVLRLAITPTIIKKHVCHDNAIKQFLAQNINHTKKRTGILLFISLAEHYAEVIPDSKISDEVPFETWTSIVDEMIKKARNDDLTGAYIEAIEKSGNILSNYFPAERNTKNELPDHIIEI